MQRTIRRLALGAASGTLLFALAACPAMATTVTTEPATNRTTTAALLNGVIDTGGQATAWQFQWGTTTAYGKGTPLQQIPGGGGIVPVSWQLTDLAPNTTYHFRLVTTTGSGSQTYPLIPTFGNDETFTTNATGRLLLLQTRLAIVNNFLSVRLRCLSGIACAGRFTISTRARLHNSKELATVLCATTIFRAGPRQLTSTRVRVRGGCLALLHSSPHQSHTATLTSNPRTGQHALIRTVSLVIG